MPTPTPTFDATSINTAGEAASVAVLPEVVNGSGLGDAAMSAGAAATIQPLALEPKQTTNVHHKKHHHHGMGATGYISIAVLVIFLLYMLKKARSFMSNYNIRQGKDDHFHSLL